MARRYALSTLICVLVAMLLCICIHAEGNDAEQSISQVVVNMPEVTVYIKNPAPLEEVQHADAYLGDRELEFCSMTQVKEEGVHYLVLLDISASISKRTFEKVKTGLIGFLETLEENNRVSLYTFGDEVKEIAADLRKAENLEEIIRSIQNLDQNTLLYEAVNLAARHAVNQRTHGRTVLIVITDGEDFALGKTTKSETMQTLEETGIPLYAYTVEASQKEYIDGMGEVARESGGDIAIAQSGMEAQAFEEIREKVEETAVLRYSAGTNRVSRERENIIIKFEESGQTLVKNVMVMNWIPDMQAPEIISAERTGQSLLRVGVSESIVGGDRIQAWKVTRDGIDIAVVSATYTEDETGAFVELKTEDVLYRGTYTIKGVGITDDSQEENKLTKTFTNGIDGPEFVEETDSREVEDSRKNSALWIITGGIMLLLMLAGICVVIIFSHNRRKQQIVRQDIYIEGKSLKVTEVAQHEKVHIEKQVGMPLTIYVDTDGRNMIKLDARIDRSIFIGRSKINNFYFDDAMLSSQHFALEYDGNIMYISDLNSVNGTKVNGVAVRSRRVLKSGDVVSAGMLRFRFVW